MFAARVHTGLLAMAIVVAPLCLAGQASSAPDQKTPTPRDWTEDRPLVWEEFLGAPDASSEGAALTAYQIQARTICEASGPTFRVSVRFLPDQSWVKPRHRTPRILAHEQGHFDLAEVTARQLRVELDLLDLGCAAGNAAFNKLVAAFQGRDGDLQRSYDKQTMFGTDITAQRAWEGRISGWLLDKSPDRRP
jgi:hypothetical protein